MEMYKYKDKDDKRDLEDALALEESISDWNKKANGMDTGRDCPLCILGIKRNGKANSRNKCTNCIIRAHTGSNECKGTPYWHHSRYDSNPEYFQREIEFLESLRPKKKVEKDVIEIGDEVIIHDPSYLFRLKNGKIGDRDDKGFQDTNYLYAIYIVLEIGIQLPEGSDHRGKYGNDTILYNPEDGSYVFMHHKFLNKAICPEPRYCPECGKAK